MNLRVLNGKMDKTHYKKAVRFVNPEIKNRIPFELTENIIDIPIEFKKHLGTIRYKRCNNPRCKNFNKESGCKCDRFSVCSKCKGKYIANMRIKILE